MAEKNASDAPCKRMEDSDCWCKYQEWNNQQYKSETKANCILKEYKQSAYNLNNHLQYSWIHQYV